MTVPTSEAISVDERCGYECRYSPVSDPLHPFRRFDWEVVPEVDVIVRHQGGDQAGGRSGIGPHRIGDEPVTFTRQQLHSPPENVGRGMAAIRNAKRNLQASDGDSIHDGFSEVDTWWSVRQVDVGAFYNSGRVQHQGSCSLLISHDRRLPTHDFVLDVRNVNLPSNHQDGQESNKSSGDRQTPVPPICSRLTLFLCLLFGGFLISLRGWLDPNDKGTGVRTTWVVGGWGVSFLGVLIWLGTLAFPSTWDWPR